MMFSWLAPRAQSSHGAEVAALLAEDAPRRVPASRAPAAASYVLHPLQASPSLLRGYGGKVGTGTYGGARDGLPPEGLGKGGAVSAVSIGLIARASWGSQRTLLMRESGELLLFFMIFI